MSKIKAIMVDDEVNNTDLLSHFLSKYCPVVDCIGIANTKQDGLDLINKREPELIFLDIMLDEGTGFDLLEGLNYSKYKVIFVTAFDDHAIKAFKYNALDYILKPIDIEQLILAVNKAFKEIENEVFTEKVQIQQTYKSITNNALPNHLIAIPSTNKIDFVKVENIIYLKSEGRYTIFHLIDKQQIVATKNLGEYESLLDASMFFRVHHSYIVNLTHVKSINKSDGNYCELPNNISIPIAKRRQDQLHKFLKIK